MKYRKNFFLHLRVQFLTGLMILCLSYLHAQPTMQNVAGRTTTSLNGKWNALIDMYDIGTKRGFYKDQKASGTNDFYEYSFENNTALFVPGDFNSQYPELKYYEGTVWYKRSFDYDKKNGCRLFIHFGAVNYKADVYLNGTKLGSHEGGFTPFQFEITKLVNEKDNFLIVRVNNERIESGVPALDFDWWNYGGITRDVSLIETPNVFIDQYFIQLAKNSSRVEGWIQLNGSAQSVNITINIPELKTSYKTATNTNGYAKLSFNIKPVLWSPANPKLYDVQISSASDKIQESIGFRNIEVKGTEIRLNGKPVFLRGINFHEEIPQRGGRACSESDSYTLLNWAKELGCNFVRLTHYPQNEYTVRLAEKMGIMLWEEIPVWQSVNFTDPTVLGKCTTFLDEMIARDRNRCAVIIWSVSNETVSSQARNEVLTNLVKHARSQDGTRLITSAFNMLAHNKNNVIIADSLSKVLDVIGVNAYYGWYVPFNYPPDELVWQNPHNKPLIMSEFGGEALQGRHGSKDTASSWSEEYQEQLYKNNLTMLKRIPFLAGTAPWVLADFRSPGRLLPYLQDGWNRKGLLSEKGIKKKAWYVMKEFYDFKKTQVGNSTGVKH